LFTFCKTKSMNVALKGMRSSIRGYWTVHLKNNPLPSLLSPQSQQTKHTTLASASAFNYLMTIGCQGRAGLSKTTFFLVGYSRDTRCPLTCCVARLFLSQYFHWSRSNPSPAQRTLSLLSPAASTTHLSPCLSSFFHPAFSLILDSLLIFSISPSRPLSLYSSLALSPALSCPMFMKKK
jgi:hypothetical protein